MSANFDHLTALYNQLTPTEDVPFWLHSACDNGNQLLIAFENDLPFTLQAIVGIASLIPIHTPRVCDGRIEDVVVDEKHRGKGIGKELIRRLLEKARKLNMKTVYLTSEPNRTAANRLYQNMGFAQYHTNTYQYNI